MNKDKLKEKLKEKKIWASGLGFLVAVGVFSASQAEWIKNILTAITGW